VISAPESGRSHSPSSFILFVIILCDGGFIVQRPFHRIAGLLEFHERRKFCWFLPGVQHCHNQVASLLTEKLAEPFQIIDVIYDHLRSLCHKVF
jgi:hypothetical protein